MASKLNIDLKDKYRLILPYLSESLATLVINNDRSFVRNLEDFRSAITDNINNLSNLNTQFNQELTNKVSTNEGLKTLKNDILASTEQMVASGRDFPLLLEQVDKLIKENETLTNANVDLELKRIECEENLRNLTKTNKELNAEIVGLKGVRKSLLEITENKAERKKLIESINDKTELTVQVNDLTKKLNAQLREKAELLSQLNQCRDKVQALTDNLEDVKKVSKQQEKKLEDKIVENQQLKSENDELERKADKLEDDNIDLNLSVNAINRKKEIVEAELNEIKEKGEIKDDGKTVQVLKSQLDTLEDEVEALVKRNDEIEDQTEEKEKKLSEREKELLDIKEKYDDVIEELKGEKKQAQELEEKLEDVQDEVEVLKTQVKVMKEPKQEVKPEDQYIVDGPIKDTACEQFKRCPIISAKKPLIEVKYLPEALPSRVDVSIDNPESNLVNIHLVLDDGVSPKPEIPTFVKYELRVKDEYKPINTSTVQISISPTSRKTYFEFNGVNIDMFVNINEFEPLVATKAGKGSIIKIKTFHQINNDDVVVREDEESLIITKWSEDASIPLTISSPKSPEIEITKDPSINEDNSTISFSFKSPSREATKSFGIKLYEGDSFKNILDGKDSDDLLEMLFFEGNEGVGQGVTFNLNIHAFKEGNDEEGRVDLNPDEKEAIDDELTVDVYLSKDTGISDFLTDTESFAVTVSGTDTKNSPFVGELEVKAQRKTKSELSSFIMSEFIDINNNNNINV